MADLFDALAARALGTAPLLVPDLTRFARRDHGPDQDPGPTYDADEPSSAANRTQAPGSDRRSGAVDASGPSVLGPLADAPDRGRPSHLLHEPTGEVEAQELRREPRPAHPGRSLPEPAPEPVAPTSARPRPSLHETTDVAQVPQVPQVADVAPVSPPPSVPLLPSAARDAGPGDAEVTPERPATRASYTGSLVHELPALSAPTHDAPGTAPAQVTVSIGYVEVRGPASPPEPRPAPRPHRPEPRLSLQEYLRREGRR